MMRVSMMRNGGNCCRQRGSLEVVDEPEIELGRVQGTRDLYDFWT